MQCNHQPLKKAPYYGAFIIRVRLLVYAFVPEETLQNSIA